MHVRSIRLKCFKRFSDKSFDFTDSETGIARSLIVLVGENGSGKSTVLQAIAAMLGTATRRLYVPAELDWPGFDFHLAGSSWNLPSDIVLDVGFDTTELQATAEYFRLVPGLSDRLDAVEPAQDHEARLRVDQGWVLAKTQAQFRQFAGRQYAKRSAKLANDGMKVFEKVGAVFWYTEQRTSTSLTADRDPSNAEKKDKDNGRLQFDENLLRRRLADWMQFHTRVERGEYTLRPGQRDLFADLERLFKAVFPTREFHGSVPRSDVNEILEEPWFFLFDGHHQYEISEMSAGERAIFPILFDFANWQINNSVILIDEIELHLHPPLQQALIRALPELGKNNQFIVTTHSDWVADLVPHACVYRMEP